VLRVSPAKRGRTLGRIASATHREFSLFFRRDCRFSDGWRFSGSALDASGRQRRGRQIMLPRAWEYEPNLPRIAGGMSSQSLLDEVARHTRQRLPFE